MMDRYPPSKGQVTWEKVHGLYQVVGGLGDGRVVRLYQVGSQLEVKAVVNFIGALRGYPDEANAFIRWLRAANGTSPVLQLKDPALAAEQPEPSP